MNKKTIVIVSLTLVLALLAVAVIATFPTYLFEDSVPMDNSSSIQSGNIAENESIQGDDVGNLAGDDDANGAEGVLPMPDDSKNEESSTSNDNQDASSNTITQNLELLAETNSVKVMAEYGAYPDGTKFKVKKLGAFDKTFYRARHYLRSVSKKFTAYNFSATNNGESVYPIANVKLTFEIPESYNSKNIAVYYLTDKNVLELDCNISKDGKTATVRITQSGVYILAEKNVSENLPEDTNSDNTSSNTNTEATSSDDTTTSNTSSEDNVSSDASSENSSADSSSDTSSDLDTSSNVSSNEDTSSDSTSSDDPNKETMDGWTPWQ